MSEHMKPQVSVADELDPVQEIQVIITTQLPKSFINTKPWNIWIRLPQVSVMVYQYFCFDED